jgi:hypothetical protein
MYNVREDALELKINRGTERTILIWILESRMAGQGLDLSGSG